MMLIDSGRKVSVSNSKLPTTLLRWVGNLGNQLASPFIYTYAIQESQHEHAGF